MSHDHGATTKVEVPPAANLEELLGRPVPENVFGTMECSFVPKELSRLLNPTDNYITHTLFTNKGESCYLILTDFSLFKGLFFFSSPCFSWNLNPFVPILLF